MYGLSDTSQGSYYTFPCSTTLHDLTLGIDNYLAVVLGEYINYAPAAGSKCSSGVQSNGGDPIIVMSSSKANSSSLSNLTPRAWALLPKQRR
jgi:hypothetical protein